MNENKLIITVTDKRFAYQAMTGVGTIQINDLENGTPIHVDAIIQHNTVNSDGISCVCTTLVDDHNNVTYQTLSPSVRDCVSALYTAFWEDNKLDFGGVDVIVNRKKSKQKRDFIVLELV